MNRIRNLLFAEWTVCLTCCFVFGMSGGIDGLKSALLGGLAYSLPNSYRSFRAFQYYGASKARLIVKGFYHGQIIKFALSMLIFALVFSQTTVNPVVFFVTYIAMQMLVGFAPLFIQLKIG